MSDWKIFKGNHHPHNDIDKLPDPPSWRSFDGADEEVMREIELRWDDFYRSFQESGKRKREIERGKSFRIQNDQGGLHKNVINMVNSALYLRRPLLVTGKPGTGKTSLAYAIAYELNLGPVLAWPITARSTIQDGLYRYDAIARLRDVQMQEAQSDIGSYIQLGPMGTALLPTRRPRVLLIDEIDKSDINLPNDLLNLFEEGEFVIPELSRMAKQVNRVEVSTDDGMEVPIIKGRVQCAHFPLIILTNNGERDFPPAFLRRCLRLNMPYDPDAKALKEIVKAHLKEDVVTNNEKKIEALIDRFRKRRQGGDLSTDQLLNAVYMVTRTAKPEEAEEQDLVDVLLKYLTSMEER